MLNPPPPPPHTNKQILEGFLYYFEAARAKALLRAIRAQSAPGSLLLADHINDFTLASLKVRGLVVGWLLGMWVDLGG